MPGSNTAKLDMCFTQPAINILFIIFFNYITMTEFEKSADKILYNKIKFKDANRQNPFKYDNLQDEIKTFN